MRARSTVTRVTVINRTHDAPTWDGVREGYSKLEQMVRQSQQMGWQSVQQAARVGAMLIALKKDTEHGEWATNLSRVTSLPTNAANLMASRLMRLAAHLPMLEKHKPESQRAALALIPAKRSRKRIRPRDDDDDHERPATEQEHVEGFFVHARHAESLAFHNGKRFTTEMVETARRTAQAWTTLAEKREGNKRTKVIPPSSEEEEEALSPKEKADAYAKLVNTLAKNLPEPSARDDFQLRMAFYTCSAELFKLRKYLAALVSQPQFVEEKEYQDELATMERYVTDIHESIRGLIRRQYDVTTACGHPLEVKINVSDAEIVKMAKEDERRKRRSARTRERRRTALANLRRERAEIAESER